MTWTPRGHDDLVARLHELLGYPGTDGNRIDVLRNGDRIFPAMIDAIEGASRTVDFCTFVYWSGDIAVRFAESLTEAARRGVTVRILLDALGARRIDEELVEQMREAGCQVRWFRPIVEGGVPNLDEANRRTHRKILVCDGAVGFIGGVGIAEEWSGDARSSDEWRDTHLAVRGPAVAGLRAAFVDNWADQDDDDYDPRAEIAIDMSPAGDSTCFVVRSSAETGVTDAWRLMMIMVGMAEYRLRIATAYFNPDDHLANELISAVDRGVDVTLLVPGEHADKRFVQIAGEECYEKLLAAGVDIRTYETSMMHAKIITVDGRIATVGSANFNQRSMQHDEEANIVVVDQDVVALLDEHFDDDLEASVDLDPERWADRSVIQRVVEKISSTVDRWI